MCSWNQGSTQGHWRFPQHGLEQAYVYIITHPGMNSCMHILALILTPGWLLFLRAAAAVFIET